MPSSPDKAWIDAAWFDTDGIYVHYAETEEEARRYFDDAPVKRLEAADGMGDVPELDRNSFFLMMGIYEVDSCVNCHATIYNPGNGNPMESDSGVRPVRVDGLGFLCDLLCLADYSRRLHGMPPAVVDDPEF